MFKRLHRAWLKHILFRSRVPYPLWKKVLESSPVLSYLSKREQHRLRKLTSLFLHDKKFTGANDYAVTTEMQVYIAAHACLLIINLGLEYFDNWTEIIVYPDAFVVKREEFDDIGLLRESRRTLAGESWERGPVILSWIDGSTLNIIVHEFAHKLDMLNGIANGMPPLHSNMSRSKWTAVWSKAYDKFQRKVQHHHHTSIDPYAAESPAEFFAVLTEVFFIQPGLLYKIYPGIYQQLHFFYRQDPLQNVLLAGK